VFVAAAFGGTVMVVALLPTIVLVYAMMPIVGAASVAMISLSNATLQLNSDPKLRGRVMALFSMALIGSSPIGGPLVGWIGEHSSARVSLLIGGIAAVGAAGYGWTSIRRTAIAAPEAEVVEQLGREPLSA